MTLSRLPSRCKFCRVKFSPEERTRGWKLHPDCIGPYAESAASRLERKRVAKAKQLKAAEARETKAKKAALVPLQKLEDQCCEIVQKIARLRDRNDGCISCDKPASWQGQWHGSHFRSRGAASAVQFNLWNIHKACWICNKLYSGRIDQYEPKLVQKIGQERVDWLKAQNHVVKRDAGYREYLVRFKKVMGKRLRRMEKKHG